MMEEELGTQQWWKAPRGNPDRLAADLVATYGYLSLEDDERRDAYVRRLQGIYDVDLESLNPAALSQMYQRFSPAASSNPIREALDTLASVVVSSKPAAEFVVDNGQPKHRRAAEQARRAIAGLYEDVGFYETLNYAYVRMVEWGNWVLKVCESPREGEKHATIEIEHVFPHRLLVDPVDAEYGKPRQWLEVRMVDRDRLLAMFPRKKKEINREALATGGVAGMITDGGQDYGSIGLGTDESNDVVTVVEAYYLPTHRGGKGRHVIVTLHDQSVLLDEDWTSPLAPYVVLSYRRPTAGIWGWGGFDEVAGVKVLLDDAAHAMKQAFRRSVPLLLAPQEMRSTLDQVDPSTLQVVYYPKGAERTLDTKIDPIIHDQVFLRYDQLREQIIQQLGVSSMSLRGEAPGQIRSGRGVKMLRVLEQKRHALKVKEYDTAVVEVTKRVVEAAERLTQAGYKLPIFLSDTNPGEESLLEWGKIGISKIPHRIRIEVASSVARELAGKNDDLMELFQLGALPPDQLLKHYNSPDMEKMLMELTAEDRLVDSQIQRIYEGEPTAPDEAQDTSIAAKKAAVAYALELAKGDKADVTSLEGLVTYLSQAVHLENKKMMAQQQAMAPAPVSPPPAAPIAPEPEIA